jgi:NAD(P)H-dependent FMN reductase
MALIGSTKDHSSNQKLVKFLKKLSETKISEAQNKANPSDTRELNADQGEVFLEELKVHWDVFPISGLPYFDPDLDKENPAPVAGSAATDQTDHQNPRNDTKSSSSENDPNSHNIQATLDSETGLESKPATFSLDPDNPQNVPKADHLRIPTVVQQLRDKIQAADGVLICTPEYVFSLPGILKNALEWLVSTTVLTNKPMALITAAASGDKAKESLELIVRTLGGRFTADTSIHIRGIAGKFNSEGILEDPTVITRLKNLYQQWLELITENKDH